MLYQVLIVVYLIVALCLIGLVLIQQGKGADMGASFGAGSSATIFGSSGSGNFLTKATTWLAIAFFVISLVLGNLTANRVKSGNEFDDLSVPVEQSIPAEVPAATSAEPASENTDVPASTETKPKSEGDVPN
ncbi:preprotein translocase subunit SecG [Thalassotalea sp. G2M2-11]|uniref:preprotein translocase subunit SecG n=1 Tax=Thalassotalea sp. G2M2-11 TaxID=2787627 RepID=UPI0019D121E7|nr:preprotein translocase subunit SecG [Thalassotalea sp. G2M2-11]